MSEDEPSWERKTGTGKEDGRPWSYVAPPPEKEVKKEEDIEFKLTNEELEIKKKLEEKIGSIKILPNKVPEDLLFRLFSKVIEGEVHLSFGLYVGFRSMFKNNIMPKRIINYRNNIINYVTEGEVRRNYLRDIAEKLSLT